MPRKVEPALPSGRERLLFAAIRLFGRHGFDALSVRQIAEEAGVSWALIRAHFGGKEGLREAAEEAVVETYLNLVTEALSARSGEALMATIHAHGHEYATFQDAVYFLRRAIMEGRPISYIFLDRLLQVQEAAEGGIKALRQLYPDEHWLQDPLPALALRIGYVLLAPYALERLGRNMFSLEELTGRNADAVRMLSLAVSGLDAEAAGRPARTPGH